MGGSEAQEPQEGRGIILQGGPGSLIHDVAYELRDLRPEGYCLISEFAMGNPVGRVPVWVVTRQETVRRLVGMLDEHLYLVQLWRPRDQVEDWLLRWVERGVRSEDWMRRKLREWDATYAEGSGVAPHLHLNLGDGQLTPPQAAEAVHLGFQRWPGRG